MLTLKGQNLREALDAIRPPLSAGGRREATDNAAQIVSAIVNTYEAEVKSGVVGENGAGPKGQIGKSNDSSRTGLVYGRIQSGKTRAMITSTALAFDNKFRVVVVITTNNNRLVDQTHQDFQNGLPGSIRVYSKAHFKKEVGQARQILTSETGGIVLICSKGATRLNQAIDFLDKIGAKEYPAVIFDDEGDQATLDTNTLKRSTKEPLIPPSRTHQLIHDPAVQSLRKALPRHIFVSVTGTPSGIVLQNTDNKSRPSFVELLKAGKEYVGGDVFFSEPKPEKNRLITLIGENERVELLGAPDSELPHGLKSAIRLFLLSASAAAASPLNWPDDNKGYKLLCHPSVKTADQEKVADLVRKYLVDLTAALTDAAHPMRKDLEASYESLSKQNPAVPTFDSLLETIRSNMPAREVLVLNKNTTGDELNYSKYFNFLIGGNTLGRGLAIKNLLVTYYVREAKVTQMDTMYQHARMFGYRNPTLPYTRLFLPPQLYERFRRIYVSDEELRSFIEEQRGSAASFPVRIAADIKATRSSVLDARKVDVLIPGRQIYPNYPFFRAPKVTVDKVHAELVELFPEYKTKGRSGKKISIEDAKTLVSLIKTNGTNVWNDKKMPTILSYLGQQFKDGIILKFRKANRTAGDTNGLLSQGVLAGPDVLADASGDNPVLWVIEMTFADSNRPAEWDGKPFVYPTLVLAKKAQLVVFNKS